MPNSRPLPAYIALTAFALAAIAGCATTILRSSDTGRTGVVYFLPRALLEVQLADVNGDLVLTVEKPQFVADERYRYVLNYVPDPAASDSFEVAIDPSTSLLQTASSTADDKTADLIVAIARSAATVAQLVAQAAGAPSRVVIFHEQIDPTQDLAEVVARMNAAAIGYSNATFARLQCESNPKLSDELKGACEGYKTWRSGSPIAFAICRATLVQCPPTQPSQPTPAVAASIPLPDCTPGVCYRAAVPYRIQFSLNLRNQYSTLVSLPNEGPVMLWPFERTAFVKRVNNAEFQNGMLKKVHVEKPSEALEAAMLPVNVVKAVFDSITGVFKFRVDLTNGEKAFVDAQKQLLDSQQALAKAMTPQSTSGGQQQNVLLSGSTSGRTVPAALRGIDSQVQAGGFPGGMVSPAAAGSGPPK